MMVSVNEYLLTTQRDLRGDAVVDRSWRLERVEGRMVIFKPDGREVHPLFSLMSCRCLPPQSVVHFGYGFLSWQRRDQDEAYLVLRGKRFVDDRGKPL